MKPLAAIAIILSAVAIAAVWASTVEQFEPAQPSSSRLVTVTNFPNPQNVAGTVSVDNLPVVQTVSGVVEVSNLPMPDPAHFRFVGVTTQTFPGGGSRAAMMQACNSEYPGSRMAFSDEYPTTVAPPAIASDAWIQPRVAAALSLEYLIDPAGSVIYDPSIEVPNRFSCGEWSTSSANSGGAFISTGGAIFTTACVNELRVACAAP